MKTSKFFFSTLIAAAAMTATAYAAQGDAVQINFNANQGKSNEGFWNDTTINANSNRALKDSNEVDTEMKAAWSATGLWHKDGSGSGILNGYLDDNNSGKNAEIRVGVTGVSYLCYDVTIYCAADKAGSFSAKTVNGVTYTYSQGSGVIVGSDSWGSGSSAGTDPVEGENCLTVSLLSGDLSISSLGDNVGQDAAGKARGNIAAVKIVDTSVAYDFNLPESNLPVNWSSSSLGEIDWKNASGLNGGSYANFTIAADAVVNVSEVIDTVAIFADGTGKLTLAGESPINMVAASKIGATSGASIEIQNEVNFSNGGVVSGSVSTSGSGVLNVSGGTLIVTDALAAGDVESIAVALSNDGAVAFDISNAGTNVDLSKISGGEDTRIKLKASGSADAFSTVRALNSNFSGSIEVTGGYLRLNDGSLLSKITSVKSIVLSGGSDSGLVFLRAGTVAEPLVFSENIVAEGSGGALRSYGSNDYSVKFTGDVTGSSISHVDGGTHTFAGAVDLDTFNAQAGVTTFSGAGTTISSLNISGNSSTKFSSNADLGNISVTGSAGELIVDSGVTVEAESMSNGWGIKTTRVDGVLNISGNMGYTTGNLINTITGSGTISVGTFTFGNAGKYQLTGGVTLEIGSGGIKTSNAAWGAHQLRIGDATLSASEDWSVSDSYTSGYIKLNSTENGGAKFDTKGHTITFGASLENLSDSEIGALTKTGEGTLILSGNNTYSGGTTISKGTVVATHANALGRGSVTVEGGNLFLEQAGTLKNLKSQGSSWVHLGKRPSASGIDLHEDTLEDAATWTLDVDSGVVAHTGTINGSIGKIYDGYHLLEKTGLGVLSITNSDSEGYGVVLVKSVTVSQGTLEVVSGASSLGWTTKADVYVASGAKFKIVMGEETIDAGAVTLADGAKLAIDLDGITPVGESITLDIISSSAITFGDRTLGNLTRSSEVEIPDKYIEFINPDAFSEYVEKSWSYNEGVLSLTLAIPEPSMFGLLAGLGALALAGTRRRRK